MTEVNEIHLLIHPQDVLFTSDPELPVPDIYIRQEEQWDQDVTYIAENPNTILVEYSGGRHAHFISEHPQEISENNPGWKRRNDRIQRYQEVLGNRYVHVDGYVFPKDQDFLKLIEENDLDINSMIKIKAYGEFYHGCVKQWSREFKEALQSLGISSEVELDQELSIDREEYIEINNLNREFIESKENREPALT